MLVVFFSPWKAAKITRTETVEMQRWEYHIAQLIEVGLGHSRGWKLKEINGQEQPDWKKTEIYSSVTDFCNQMSQQGWELASADYPGYPLGEVALYFKRLLQ